MRKVCVRDFLWMWKLEDGDEKMTPEFGVLLYSLDQSPTHLDTMYDTVY